MKFKNIAAFVCLGLLFVFCMTPSFYMATVLSKRVQLSIAVILLSLSVLLLLFCVYKKFPRLMALVFGALALGAIVEVQFISYFGTTINSNALSLLSESNVSEVSDLLSMLPKWLYFLCAVVVVLTTFLLFKPIDLRKINLKPLFFTNIAVFVFIFSFLQINMYMFDKIMRQLNTLHEYQDSFTFKELPESLAIRGAYPTGLPFIVYDYYEQRKEFVAAAQLIENFRFNAVKDRSDPEQKRQIYILVIGESGTYAHWGINGYARNTSPLLSHRDNLLSYNNMYTSQTLTRESVPVIITRKPPTLRSAVFNEASIVTYFKEIGFETAWISMQLKFGYHDSPISIHAFEADHVLFLNPGDYRLNGKQDYESIPEVQNLINASDQDLFIVIHTLGSHFRYSDRYRDDKKVFLPDHRAGYRESLLNPDDKELLINSYDNSILETDAFLNSVIELLEDQQDTDSWMFYVSDHGQALFDDCSNRAGMGFSSPAVHHIPAFFWASPGYTDRHGEELQAMRANNEKMLSTSMVFDTLVSLGGGYIPNEREGMDLTRLDLQSPPPDVQLISFDSCIRNEGDTNQENGIAIDFGL